jgi:hypothetical protein
MVRMSVLAPIWFCLIPYPASSAGVATYAVPLKLFKVPACTSVAEVPGPGWAGTAVYRGSAPWARNWDASVVTCACSARTPDCGWVPAAGP